MSNVPKSKRKLSELEFYNNALNLRRLVTSWLLRDFGIKPTRRSPENFVKRYHFTQEDAERFTEVLDRYGLGQSIYEHFEDWWINARRLQIDRGIQDILHYIRKANAIYPTCEQEYYERRLQQDRAIGACEVLLDDLAFVAETVSGFGVRLNQYQQIVDALNFEIALIKGWRKADNKFLSALRKEKGAN